MSRLCLDSGRGHHTLVMRENAKKCESEIEKGHEPRPVDAEWQFSRRVCLHHHSSIVLDVREISRCSLFPRHISIHNSMNARPDFRVHHNIPYVTRPLKAAKSKMSEAVLLFKLKTRTSSDLPIQKSSFDCTTGFKVRRIPDRRGGDSLEKCWPGVLILQ